MPSNILSHQWELGPFDEQKRRIEKQINEEHPAQVYNSVVLAFLNCP